jgi:hypothetical protein
VTNDSTPKLDDIDKEMEQWLAENEVAAEVMGSIITIITDQAEKYHIPHPMVYVHLSVLSILIRSQMTTLAGGDPAKLAQIAKLDQFIGRMSGNGKDYQELMLREIAKFEAAINKPPDKTEAKDECANARMYQ